MLAIVAEVFDILFFIAGMSSVPRIRGLLQLVIASR